MQPILDYSQRTFAVSRPADVRWTSAANQTDLARALASDAMVIEVDVRVAPMGDFVVAHPPALDSDLLFTDVLGFMADTQHMLKVDFKDPEALIPCLQLLAAANLQQPVILNADLFLGNSTGDFARFNPYAFIGICKKYYQRGILSLGWVTEDNPTTGYTRANIDQMLELVGNEPHIIFPIRSSLLERSWPEVQRLLAQPDRALFVWGTTPLSDLHTNIFTTSPLA